MFYVDIEGEVADVIFHNDDTGFTVLTLDVAGEPKTVVGEMVLPHEGEIWHFYGSWGRHRDYGEQFRAEKGYPVMPSTAEGIIKYLSSGLIKGVGRQTAISIVTRFGEDTLTVMQSNPELLSTIPGIGKKRAKMIADSFAEQSDSRAAILFLQSNGLSSGQAMEVYKKYGDKTIPLIKENPYRLIDDIYGIGFRISDRLAESMGIAADDPFRLRAGVSYSVNYALQNGSTYVPYEELKEFAGGLLGVDENGIEAAVIDLAREGAIKAETIDNTVRIYSARAYRAEDEAAHLLTMLGMGGGSYEASGLIEDFEQRSGIRFSRQQREAIEGALKSPVFVITGGPGTGKTTIINCIVGIFESFGMNVQLAAPTGRAAKRMSEATGRDASTIHRLLEYSFSNSMDEDFFNKSDDDPLDADVLILDEASMLDVFLFEKTLRAMKHGSRLILVGDADQLPSVGPGRVLGDILSSGVFPHIYLTEIYRQARESLIITNAHSINDGDMPVLNDKTHDFFFERRYSPADVLSSVVSLCSKRLPEHFGLDPLRDIQVLSPMKKGAAGVYALNRALQQAINPPSGDKPECSHGEFIFRRGDRVMQIKNNYEMEWVSGGVEGTVSGRGVFNGDIGVIDRIDREEETLGILFDDDKYAVYGFSDLDNLEPAYAVSIHKSQGSEFPAVVLPIVNGPSMLFTKNLLYTAVTRAKKLVVIVGREDTVARMVANNYIKKRYTALADRILEKAVPHAAFDL